VSARGRAIVSALFLAALLGACLDNHPVIMIKNRVDFPVTIGFVNSLGHESSLVDTVEPGLDWSVDVFPTTRCTPGFMIARDKATGAEVARSQGPVCRPSVWVIEAPAASP
jgi:hypothetical protein